jgi:uncharacterized protein (DUF1501 family)
MSNDQSRRAFLKRSAVLGVAGSAAPFVTNLAAIGEAAAAVSTDYKALVCVFLFGGNDYANTLPPYDQASYNLYNNFRSALAYGRDALTPTLLNPTTALASGRQYALAPELAPLLPVFDAGKMAVLLNVGTLVQPTTKAQYQARNVPLPPKLFSHNDQQSFFQASNPEGATSGWGGRIGDLFQSGNGNATLTCINASGNAVFLAGRQAIQYAVSSNGPVPLNNNSNNLFGSSTANATLRSLIAEPKLHLVNSALMGAPAINTVFPTGNSLADQLRIVARLISVSSELGAKRQVFFVSTGGFDNHDNLVAQHGPLLTRVSTAMRAFYDTTVELGVADKVTAFTASDFGRTLLANTSGSDHGWGSNHFAVGGAVRGKQIYGTPPVIADNGPDDVGQGRLIPTISVDQYAATLANWFGVAGQTDLRTVLPNIGNYTTQNIGFI